LGPTPDILIDVSNQYKKWTKAISFHESQMKTKGYLNLISSKAHAYGASIGVEYAIPLWCNDPMTLDNLSDLDISSRKY
ncbi:MAG: hypothetical protein ABIS26_01930, partial [Candidatus Paceibacterota bacterium]